MPRSGEGSGSHSVLSEAKDLLLLCAVGFFRKHAHGPAQRDRGYPAAAYLLPRCLFTIAVLPEMVVFLPLCRSRCVTRVCVQLLPTSVMVNWTTSLVLVVTSAMAAPGVLTNPSGGAA